MTDVSRCFFHGNEPVTPDTYRVCGECWHVWETAEALVAAADAERIEAGGTIPITNPEKVFSCPECIHDF